MHAAKKSAPIDLISLAKGGDCSAFDVVLERFGGSIHGLCRRLDPEPDDCCQEVRARILRDIHRF